MHYTTSCNTQSSAPEDGQNNCPKLVELTGIINKPLLLHLVGCLYYLYQGRAVKKISDNEVYLLIKYIKSVLWRVAKCLSCIEEARCLKVNRTVSDIVSKFLHVRIQNLSIAMGVRCFITFRSALNSLHHIRRYLRRSSVFAFHSSTRVAAYTSIIFLHAVETNMTDAYYKGQT